MEKSATEPGTRASWGGNLEFVLTCIGLAVGLGNVWRFPYLAYQNGGGAFLIPYFVSLILIGLPMYFLELSLGQFASLSAVKVWKMSPMFKGVGVAAAVIVFYIVIYSNVIISWAMYFMVASMTTGDLPWTTCDNEWNTITCQIPANGSVLANSTSPSEEYFYNQVLGLTDGFDNLGVLKWQLVLCLFISWIIVFIVLIKGIESLGKASYFMTTLPYVLMTCMLVRGATLEGAANGIKYYLKPDISRLSDPKVWGDAATQIFYSLGLCEGNLIAMASYNSFNQNILKFSLLIPLINCLTSLYAGFIIFTVLGFMASSKNIPIEAVATEGPGLVFVVYPEGLATMPLPQLWSILFFFMLMLIGFSSIFSLSESIISVFLDQFPSMYTGVRPQLVRAAFCLICFTLALPMVCEGGFYWFKLVDKYSASYAYLFVGFLQLVAVAWVYGYDRFADDISMMLGRKPPLYYKICWKFLSPLMTIATLVLLAIQEKVLTFGDYVYPDWASLIGWLICLSPLIYILMGMAYTLCTNGAYEAWLKSLQPEPDWGPARVENCVGRYNKTYRESISTLAVIKSDVEIGKTNDHTNEAYEISNTDLSY